MGKMRLVWQRGSMISTRSAQLRRVNNNYNRHANGVPQTIEELKSLGEGR